jgi:hypothetical protein
MQPIFSNHTMGVDVRIIFKRVKNRPGAWSAFNRLRMEFNGELL